MLKSPYTTQYVSHCVSSSLMLLSMALMLRGCEKKRSDENTNRRERRGVTACDEEHGLIECG